VRSLSHFLSGPPELMAGELADFEQESGIALPPGAVPLAEEWFTPDQGITTAQALLDYLRQSPGTLSPLVDVALRELREVLEAAKCRGLQWHFDLF
jgi:hypothetical protein